MCLEAGEICGVQSCSATVTATRDTRISSYAHEQTRLADFRLMQPEYGFRAHLNAAGHYKRGGIPTLFA